MKKNDTVEPAIVFQEIPSLDNVDFNKQDNYNPSMEHVIYGSYIRHERLTSLIYGAFHGTSLESSTEVNLFIDLYSVLHPVFSSRYRTDVVGLTTIASTIINMCAHYRVFFRTLSVHANIYLIFSGNCSALNQKFVPGYNGEFASKFSISMYQKIVGDNLALLQMLCPYLPDIHYVDSLQNYEVSVIIAYLIEKLNDGRPNIIISRDIYPIQLTTLYRDTAMLYPSKVRGGDNSFIIPTKEHYLHEQEFWKLVTHKRNIALETMRNISSINFALWSALYRMPERWMLPVLSAKDSVKLIYKMVGTEEMKITFAQLYTPEIMNVIPSSIIENRYKVLDVPYLLNFYRDDIESKSISLQNLTDNETVNQINAKFFENNPLELAKL